MKWIWQDSVFLGGIAAHLGAFITTLILLAQTKQQLGSKAYYLEANPFARLAFQSPAVVSLIFLIVSSIALLGIYLMSRKAKNSPLMFNLVTFAFFFMLVFDFLNDFSIFLKVL
jgi:hypothetical protein